MAQADASPPVLAREPMRPVDVAWLRMDGENSLMQINGVIALGGRVGVDEVRRRMLERWRHIRRFRQRVVRRGLRYYWEDDPEFDIARHVVETALPAPGDEATAQRLFGALMAEPLDPARPLWRFHVIPDYAGGSALFARLHHAVGDGVGLLLVLLSLLDLEPEVTDPVTGERHANPFEDLFAHPDASLAAFRRIADDVMPEAMRLLLTPVEALRRTNKVLTGVAAAAGLVRLLLYRPDPQRPLKGPLVPEKRAVWTRPLPLDEVKAVGRALGATINDVLLAAVGGGLRRYLAGRGVPPRDGQVIRATMPVNLRSLERMRELGNQFGLAFLGIPIGIEDPLRRLADLKRRADKVKRGVEPLVVYGLLHVAGMVPAPVERLMLRIFGSKATAVMTNVPGPRRTVYFAGRPVEDLLFWVPQAARLGLGISILSYRGRVRLGFAADGGIVPDAGPLLDAFHAEWDALRELAARRPAADPGAAREAAPDAAREAAPGAASEDTRDAACRDAAGRLAAP